MAQSWWKIAKKVKNGGDCKNEKKIANMCICCWIRSDEGCFSVFAPYMILVSHQVPQKWSKMAQNGQKWPFSPHPHCNSNDLNQKSCLGALG